MTATLCTATPNPVTVTLPLNRHLRKNSDLSPIARRGAGKHLAQMFAVLLREQWGCIPRFARVEVWLEAVYPSGRAHWDSDSLIYSFAACRDALTDRQQNRRQATAVRMGVIPDDSAARYIQHPPTETVDRTLSAPCLRVTVLGHTESEVAP